MADNAIDLAKLIPNCPYGITDLSIKLGNHIWQVHSGKLFKECPCFEEKYGETVQAAEVTTAIIEGQNPWLIARFIQYLYFNDFEYVPGRSSIRGRGVYSSPPEHLRVRQTCPGLDDLVRIESFESQDEYNRAKAADRKRLKLRIDIDMMAIAEEYGMEGLKVTVRDNMICFLEAQEPVWRYREAIAVHYPLIHNALRNFMTDYTESCMLVDRLVQFLITYKYKSFWNDSPNAIRLFPHDESPEPPRLRKFQMDMAGIMSNGGPFALKLASANEMVTQKLLQDPNRMLAWYEKQKDSLIISKIKF